MAYTFKYTDYFRDLTQAEIDDAYDLISTIFYGVSTLWAKLPSDLKLKKRELCYQFLTAWHLCNIIPARVKNIDFEGRALTSKNIGGVTLSFIQSNSSEYMKQLNNNIFGVYAKNMIESSPERNKIYG